MRRIIRRREIVADELHYPGEEPRPGTRAVLPVAAFIAVSGGAGAGADAMESGNASLPPAVLLGADEAIDPLVPHLARIGVIVIEFPKPGDGRGFSQARLLRTRHGYRHELRARGVLKRDQLFFLARSGFDAFELDPTEDLAASLAAFESFSVAYQPGSDELVRVRTR